MTGADCAKDHLTAFKQQTAQICNQSFSANGLSLVYEPSSSNSHITTEYETICDTVYSTYCPYDPYEDCYTTSDIICTDFYYDRVHQTDTVKNGNYLHGSNSVNSDCYYYTQGLELASRKYIERTTYPIWTDTYQQTSQYWASNLDLNFQLDDQSFSKTLYIDKTNDKNILESQAQNFIRLHCTQAQSSLNLRNTSFYDAAWSQLNKTLPDLEVQKSIQEKIVYNHSAILSDKQRLFDEADERYRTQLSIHLPILFIAAPLVGILSLYGIYRGCHFNQKPNEPT